MSLLPNVIGFETADGNDADQPLPDGTRQLMKVRLPSEMTATSSFDGSITRITLGIDKDALADVGPTGAYQHAERATTTIAAGASATQLDSFEHGLTNGLLTIEAWCEAIDATGASSLYAYTEQWAVADTALSQARSVNPTEEGNAASWPFGVYDAGSGAIGLRATPDPNNTTTFKWEWRISVVEQPS